MKKKCQICGDVYEVPDDDISHFNCSSLCPDCARTASLLISAFKGTSIKREDRRIYNYVKGKEV